MATHKPLFQEQRHHRTRPWHTDEVQFPHSTITDVTEDRLSPDVLLLQQEARLRRKDRLERISDLESLQCLEAMERAKQNIEKRLDLESLQLLERAIASSERRRLKIWQTACKGLSPHVPTESRLSNNTNKERWTHTDSAQQQPRHPVLCMPLYKQFSVTPQPTRSGNENNITPQAVLEDRIADAMTTPAKISVHKPACPAKEVVAAVSPTSIRDSEESAENSDTSDRSVWSELCSGPDLPSASIGHL